MVKCQTIGMKENIEANAKFLNDTVFLRKISSVGDIIAKEVKYHRPCLIAYRDRANIEKPKNINARKLWNVQLRSWKQNYSFSAMFFVYKTSYYLCK